MARKSKFEITQGTSISVSKAIANDVNATTIVWLEIASTAKDLSYTGGQKTDIEVTTLLATEQEMINGLSSPGEFTISGNWSKDEEGQEVLRKAYETDGTHAFKVVFPSGNGYLFLAEVRQNSWSASGNGIVTASFTLRVSGKLVPVNKKP